MVQVARHAAVHAVDGHEQQRHGLGQAPRQPFGGLDVALGVGPLGAYLAMQGVLSLPEKGGTVHARLEQGDAMGKPGRVELEISGRARQVERARIGGVAVTVFEGTLKV